MERLFLLSIIFKTTISFYLINWYIFKEAFRKIIIPSFDKTNIIKRWMKFRIKMCIFESSLFFSPKNWILKIKFMIFKNKILKKIIWVVHKDRIKKQNGRWKTNQDIFPLRMLINDQRNKMALFDSVFRFQTVCSALVKK